jgi:hypothetical protein
MVRDAAEDQLASAVGECARLQSSGVAMEKGVVLRNESRARSGAGRCTGLERVRIDDDPCAMSAAGNQGGLGSATVSPARVVATRAALPPFDMPARWLIAAPIVFKPGVAAPAAIMRALLHRVRVAPGWQWLEET